MDRQADSAVDRQADSAVHLRAVLAADLQEASAEDHLADSVEVRQEVSVADPREVLAQEGVVVELPLTPVGKFHKDKRKLSISEGQLVKMLSSSPSSNKDRQSSHVTSTFMKRQKISKTLAFKKRSSK